MIFYRQTSATSVTRIHTSRSNTSEAYNLDVDFYFIFFRFSNFIVAVASKHLFIHRYTKKRASLDEIA